MKKEWHGRQCISLYKEMAGTCFILTVIFILVQNPLISSNPSLFVLTSPSVFYNTSISKVIWKVCPQGNHCGSSDDLEIVALFHRINEIKMHIRHF